MSAEPVAKVDAYSEGFEDAMKRLQEYVEQARAMAIAEAARVCEQHARANWNDDRRAQAKLDAKEIRALSSPPSVSEESAAAFTEWLCREMPPGTIIGDPKWWAPKIYRKALAALGVEVKS